MELDNLDRLAAAAFDGFLVRKDLDRKYSRQYPVPTYVVEFLLGRYCATVDDEEEIEEGLKADVLTVLSRGRSHFTTDEWKRLLIRSIGLEPETLSERSQIVALLRMVPFDEISGISFDKKDGVNIMKGYMASGEFSRGKESIRAFGDLVMAIRE